MFFIILSFIYTSTLRTHIKFIASFAFTRTLIVGHKWMSMNTSFFSSIYRSWTNATKYVCFMRSQKKMFNVYTRSVSAKMVQLQRGFVIPFRNISNQHFPKESMSFVSFASPVNTTIAIAQVTSIIPTIVCRIKRYLRINPPLFFVGEFNHRPIIAECWPIS